MERVQVYLTPEQVRKLDEVSRQKSVPKAVLIRRGIDLVLREQVPADQDPLLNLIGLGESSGPTDVSERHDHYLGSWELSHSDETSDP